MDDMGGDLLQQAEHLLKSGNKQGALSLLAGYVRDHPNSARAWWLLGFAVTDLQQQIECMERVLRIDPNHMPAQTQLQKLKKEREPKPSSIEPDPLIVEEQKTFNTAPQPLKPSENGAISRPSEKKRTAWPLVLAFLSICALISVLGLAVTFSRSFALPLFPALRASPTPIHTMVQITLPATWTPTVTSEPSPTNTFIAGLKTTEFDPLQTATVDLPNFDDWLAPGMDAPDFTMENIANGQNVSLSEYKGKPVIIFFFVTWCGFCDRQVPALTRIQEEYKNDGLIVLGVDVGESEEKAQAFLQKYDLSFPVFNDDDREIFRLYKGSRYPTLYFIDTDGKVSTSTRGLIDYTSLTIRVSVLLNKISTPIP